MCVTQPYLLQGSAVPRLEQTPKESPYRCLRPSPSGQKLAELSFQLNGLHFALIKFRSVDTIWSHSSSDQQIFVHHAMVPWVTPTLPSPSHSDLTTPYFAMT